MSKETIAEIFEKCYFIRMEQITQDEIEEKIRIIEFEKMPEVREKYLCLQNQLVETQGFVSMKLQMEVELAKNEYIALKDNLDELKSMLSFMEDLDYE
ncbi:MAG: hypothetical protein II563_07410 [Treponema sp.]|nr:hypothetical protein [Treponema sp.]